MTVMWDGNAANVYVYIQINIQCYNVDMNICDSIQHSMFPNRVVVVTGRTTNRSNSNTPLKTNMDPENIPLERKKHLQTTNFWVPC